MPSPFPGMDPYLEDPGLWPDVHSRLINVASELLLSQLRPRYFVQIEERVYVADETDEGRDVIVPDIHIRQLPSSSKPQPTARGGIAVAAGIEIDAPWTLEIHESRLAIFDREQQRVVTVIELLSPTNKVRGSSGKRSYDEKKREILLSQTSLVEIDLLREGTPIYTGSEAKDADYLVQVGRWTSERRRRTLFPIKLAERLPTIPIPVRSGDEDAALDLQLAIDTVYDRAGYDLRIDYAKEPTPPMRADHARWVRDVLARSTAVR
jgi:hypothetical protein